MTLVCAADIVAFLAVVSAAVVLVRAWRVPLRRDAKWVLAGLLVVSLFEYGSNVLEWSGITKALDVFEDYTEILEPILWASLFYACLQELTAWELRRRVRERTAELAKSNAELEQFAYVASHDLQEPLRMISSYLQLLAQDYKGRLDAEADEMIDFAVDGAHRMRALIDDLLAYSRVSTRGRAFEAVDLGAVLADVLTDMKVSLAEAGAEVTSDALPTVPADAGQLRRVFQNLIGNAIKYRGERASCIHVSAEPAGEEWHLAVRDNGIGFDPEYGERIFEIFRRLHGRKDYPGTGIGLSICRKIIERHHGRIWAESEPGKGATFHFTLPKKETGA